jgi:cation transport regulator ChaC
MTRTTLYFAYGSNLDPDQMRWRCPGAVAGPRATLAGLRLAFGGRSRAWGGAVATLVREPESQVEGLLYRLPSDELTALDRYEGHPSIYRRQRLQVTEATGRRRRPWVYLLSSAEAARPTVAYFARLWRAYRRLGLNQAPLVAAVGGVR